MTWIIRNIGLMALGMCILAGAVQFGPYGANAPLPAKPIKVIVHQAIHTRCEAHATMLAAHALKPVKMYIPAPPPSRGY